MMHTSRSIEQKRFNLNSIASIAIININQITKFGVTSLKIRVKYPIFPLFSLNWDPHMAHRWE